jgi:hypothetical protein
MRWLVAQRQRSSRLSGDRVLSVLDGIWRSELPRIRRQLTQWRAVTGLQPTILIWVQFFPPARSGSRGVANATSS